MTGISYQCTDCGCFRDRCQRGISTHRQADRSSDREIKEASETYLKGVLEYVDDEVVSGDFVGDSHAHPSFDSRQTIELNDHFFKLIAYYDNEFGYSSNLLEYAEIYASEVDCE